MSQQRITFVILVIFSLFLILEFKVFSLQIINGSYYRLEAQKRSTKIELIPALRGKICDRNGSVLVEESPAFDVYLTPFQINKHPETILSLAKVLGVELKDLHEKINKINERIKNKAKNKSAREQKKIIRKWMRTSYKIWSNIPKEIAEEIYAYHERYPGIFVREKSRRKYLYDNLACHILGYMGQISAEEYKKFKKDDYFKDHLHEMVDDVTYEVLEDKGEFLAKQMGRFGVEKQYDKRLIGVDGVRMMEVDFINRSQKELSRLPPVDGKDLNLTIDLDLQQKVESLLVNKIGSVIIMDIHTGEIWAMASSPCFNPNLLQSPVSKETVKYIFHHPDKPLYNRAVSGSYAPGSLFKLVTGTAALEEGKINSSTSFNCDGYFSRRTKYFKCWTAEYNRGHGSMNITSGIQNSCNIFFFQIGKMTDHQSILKWASRYGYGTKTHIDLMGEVSGLLPSPEQKLKRYQKKWALSDTLNISIGQGDLMVSPVQVVRMMAAIANGGKLVIPHLLLGQSMPHTNINISEKTLSLLREGLYNVVNRPGGTARIPELAKFSVVGKTSTAEVSSKVVTRKSHAWFTGFAPFNKPRFAFVVMIEHGGKGSQAAAPIAAGFAETALKVK